MVRPPVTASPVRVRIKEKLLQGVMEGRYKPGERIPSERDLAKRYSVSRASVRETLTEMTHSGTLFRSVGKGTFVSSDVRPGALPPASPARSRAGSVEALISENIFNFVQPGYDKILSGIGEVCRGRNCQVLFNLVGDDFSDGEPEPAGRIVVGGLPHRCIERLRGLDVPTVLVDLLIRNNTHDLSSIRIDYATGTKIAVQELGALGHEKIGYIGFARSEKYEWYWRTLESLALPYEPRMVEFLDPLGVEPGILAGYHAMQRIIKRRRLPTAILAINDLVAVGVLEALGTAGMQAPRDMSVVGFDDLAQTSPALTTVRVDLNRVGQLAAEALFRRISGETTAPENILVPVELVVRGSTAPLKKS